jgi:hypothetical protein
VYAGQTSRFCRSNVTLLQVKRHAAPFAPAPYTPEMQVKRHDTQVKRHANSLIDFLRRLAGASYPHTLVAVRFFHSQNVTFDLHLLHTPQVKRHDTQVKRHILRLRCG